MGNFGSSDSSSSSSSSLKVLDTFREEHLKPSGLYASTPHYTTSQIRKLISTGLLAPRTVGRNNAYSLSSGHVDVECPICFLFYDQSRINTALCCDHPICTECFLQVKPLDALASAKQRQKGHVQSSASGCCGGGVCPFCNGGPTRFVLRPHRVVSVAERSALVAEESEAEEKAKTALHERLVRSSPMFMPAGSPGLAPSGLEGLEPLDGGAALPGQSATGEQPTPGGKQQEPSKQDSYGLLLMQYNSNRSRASSASSASDADDGGAAAGSATPQSSLSSSLSSSYPNPPPPTPFGSLLAGRSSPLLRGYSSPPAERLTTLGDGAAASGLTRSPLSPPQTSPLAPPPSMMTADDRRNLEQQLQNLQASFTSADESFFSNPTQQRGFRGGSSSARGGARGGARRGGSRMEDAPLTEEEMIQLAIMQSLLDHEQQQQAAAVAAAAAEEASVAAAATAAQQQPSSPTAQQQPFPPPPPSASDEGSRVD